MSEPAFLVLVIWALYVLIRDLIRDNRNHSASLRQQDQVNKSLFSAIDVLSGQITDIKSQIAELKEILARFITRTENQFQEIRDELKDIRNEIKISNFKHEALETRVTKIEAQSEPPTKSKQA